MKLDDRRAELRDHLLEKYRQLINDRYEYAVIKRELSLSDDLTEEITNDVRGYFLDHLYPPREKRERLDAAFESLGNYIAHPSKVWRLMGNMTLAIFRFGKHLPGALKAGMVSFEAFIDARKFEEKLLEAAEDHDMQVPLSDEEFLRCVSYIEKKEIVRFIKDIESLFRSMINTDLLAKTIQIMKDVIKKMEKYPDDFPKEEVEGIYMGVSILENGYDIFIKNRPRINKKIIEIIVKNENLFVKQVYG